jgi:hypothetical protein
MTTQTDRTRRTFQMEEATAILAPTLTSTVAADIPSSVS